MTRLRVYLALVLLAGGTLLIWQLVHPDTWSCDLGQTCRTSFGEELYASAMMAIIVGILCAAFELTYRTWMRRRQIRHGDAPKLFPPVPAPARFLLYVLAVALIVLTAADAGVTHFQHVNCSGSDGGDCDMGGYEGLAWGFCAFVLAGPAAISSEVILTRRRRAQRSRFTTEQVSR